MAMSTEELSAGLARSMASALVLADGAAGLWCVLLG